MTLFHRELIMNLARIRFGSPLRPARAFGALLLALLLLGQSFAQSFPARPVKIVIGFPPGATIGIVTRTVGEKMAEDLGQPVIVENRPGASGILAAETVARASADGHTLYLGGCSADAIVYAFVTADRPPLDPFKDFTPVGRVMRDHWLIVVSPALGVASLGELVALGKSKPGTLAFPSPGPGTSVHLQNERFRMRAGFAATHVPYKDSPFPDLIAGRLSFTVQPSPALASHIRSGKLKALAVLSAARMTAFPDVPTTAEVGFPDLVYNAGVCLYAPGGTPRDVVMRLNAALDQAEASDTVKHRFADLGLETVRGTPEDAARFIGELMALVDGLRLAVFGKAR
jgi:tripartite-type tricarboxylate transporter receptor subunit TctC